MQNLRLWGKITCPKLHVVEVGCEPRSGLHSCVQPTMPQRPWRKAGRLEDRRLAAAELRRMEQRLRKEDLLQLR